MNRRSFLTILLGALTIPFLKPRALRMPDSAAVATAEPASTRTYQFPTVVVIDRAICIGCTAISLFYDESMPAPFVMSIEHYLNGEKAVAWAEERNTPVVVDRELAHALAGRVTVGEYLPREFYRAVAEIVARLERTWAARIESASFDWTSTVGSGDET